MEELTLLLMAASIGLGAAGFMVRRPDSRLFSLASVVSVLAIASVSLDPSVERGSGMFLVAVVAPLAVMIYSLSSMILGRS